MIFKPRFPSRPPAGRIDMVIYFGAGVPMADWRFYACDFDSGEIVFLDPADFGGFPPGGPAGGDLSGTYPNPSIDTVPDGALSGNVPVMSAGVLPAVDGSLLTNLPGPANLASGFVELDGDGSASASIPPGADIVVLTWRDSPGVGQLYANVSSPGSVNIASSQTSTDAGRLVNWICF